MRRAIAAALACGLACAAQQASNQAECRPGSVAATEQPPACADEAEFVAADLKECTDRPAVQDYVAAVRRQLLDDLACSGTAPASATLRFRIRRDGAFDEPCRVDAASPLTAAALAAIRKMERAPTPEGDVTCIVGAPVTAAFTLRAK